MILSLVLQAMVWSSTCRACLKRQRRMRRRVGHLPIHGPWPAEVLADCSLHANCAEWSPHSRAAAGQPTVSKTALASPAPGVSRPRPSRKEADAGGALAWLWCLVGLEFRSLSKEQVPGQGRGCWAMHVVLWNLATLKPTVLGRMVLII